MHIRASGSLGQSNGQLEGLLGLGLGLGLELGLGLGLGGFIVKAYLVKFLLRDESIQVKECRNRLEGQRMECGRHNAPAVKRPLVPLCLALLGLFFLTTNSRLGCWFFPPLMLSSISLSALSTFLMLFLLCLLWQPPLDWEPTAGCSLALWFLL